jgi:6-phosphogluconolactonase
MNCINAYTEKSKFISDATALINKIVTEAKSKYGYSNILLSGGSTPGPIYNSLNGIKEFSNNLKIGLVDERFVAYNSVYSNEKLVREIFSNLDTNSIVGMVHDINDPEENLKLLASKYDSFLERLDLVVLGMGKDGHFASIFPNDKLSIDSLNKDGSFFKTKAPDYPVDRITSSLNLLIQSAKIILLITGKEKLQVLLNNKLELPVHKIFEKRKDIITLYLEENE